MVGFVYFRAARSLLYFVISYLSITSTDYILWFNTYFDLSLRFFCLVWFCITILIHSWSEYAEVMLRVETRSIAWMCCVHKYYIFWLIYLSSLRIRIVSAIRKHDKCTFVMQIYGLIKSEWIRAVAATTGRKVLQTNAQVLCHSRNPCSGKWTVKLFIQIRRYVRTKKARWYATNDISKKG